MTPAERRGRQFDFAREGFASSPAPWARGLRALAANPAAIVAAAILAVIVVLAVLADLVPAVQRHDPATPDFASIDEPPSGAHWLGADQLGRDNWARLLQGTLYSLKVGLLAEAVIVVLGVSLGAAAALGGRFADRAVTFTTDLAYAFPDLLLIILLRQVLLGRDWPVIGDGDPQIPGFPGGLLVIVFAIPFVSWVTIGRLVRGQLLVLRDEPYVQAARATGAGEWRVLWAHLLPNISGTILVAVTFGIPACIFAEAALGFIGLTAPPPFASLGTLVNDGYARVATNGLLVALPCAMIALLMVCFTLLGDGLRDALDPRTR